MDSVQKAAEWLNEQEGAALLTTGSKELAAFTRVKDYEKRLYARVLSLPKVAAQCAELGFTGKHLICMQGPFSAEMNRAMIRQYCTSFPHSSFSCPGFPSKENTLL